MDARDALAVWDALVEVGTPYGITPAGMLALDVARIEAGLMLLDVDYVSANKALIESQTSSPYELDLAWAVDLGKEQFVGKPALAAEARRGPEWQFVGVAGRLGLVRSALPRGRARAAGPGCRVAHERPALRRRRSRRATRRAACWSPLLKQYIALAHVRSRWAAPGTALEMEVTVEHRRRRAAARVAKKPFFNPERKRT